MALDPLKFRIAIERGNIKQELADVKKELTAGLKDVPISFKIANLESIKQQLQNLEVKVNISGTSDQKKQVDNIKGTVSELEKLLAMQEKVQTALQKMDGLKSSGKLVDGFTDAERKLQEFADKLAKVDYNNAQAVKDITAEWKNLGAAITEVAKKQEKANAGDSKLTSQYEKSLNQAKKALADVDILLGKMEKKSASASSLGIDVTEINKRITALKQYREVIDKVAQGSMKTKNFNDLLGGGFVSTVKHGRDELRKLEKAIKDEEKALSQAEKAAAKNASSMSSGASAVRQMTTEEQKLASAIQNTISQMNHQSQVLNDLKSMAFQYLSVYGAQQFLNNIIEIGGQLEMQRLSIGAILQNTAQANDLFDKIKGLALQSPFGVVELDQFTKQLSAYGFQYNELFDMTKRLADISAGAGTDVSRLALALGHVRAEGALTGYTLRQFAMNNIPMLGKLSEKLSELEGRTVTASEVRKRVSKKEVDYAMVESVIKELTDEGGMFYNMQETISQSVKAKWKNLRDAFDIMYGEMAESAVGGTLKDTATILTAMAKRWKELGTIILNVAKAYGAYKAYMMVYNMLLGKQARAVLSTVAAQRQVAANNAHVALSYRTLTATERAAMLTSQKLTLAERARMLTGRSLTDAQRLRIAMSRKQFVADTALALSNKQLTIEELARAVALGKVSKAQARAAITGSALTAEEQRQGIAVINNVRTFGRYTGIINGMSMAFTRLGLALKGIVANPATWIFALIAGLTDLWQRNNQEMEKAAEISRALSERASEGVKNIRNLMGETGMSYEKNGQKASFGDVQGGEIKYAPATSLDSGAMVETMEKWEEFIKNYAATPNRILNDAFFDQAGNVRSLTEQYNHLAESVKMVSQAYAELSPLGDIVEDALAKTKNGWFDEGLLVDLKDLTNRTKEYDSAITTVVKSYGKYLTEGLKAAKGNKLFAETIEILNQQMMEKQGRNLTEAEQLDYLIKHQATLTEAYKKFSDASALKDGSSMLADAGVSQAFTRMASAHAEAKSELDQMMQNLKAGVEKVYGDIDKLTESRKQSILMALGEILGKAEGISDEVVKEFMKFAAEEFKIPIDADTSKVFLRIGAVEEELNKLVDPSGKGDGWVIDFKGSVDINSIIQKMREAYKSAKDTVNNMAPILFKMGFTIGQVQVMSEADIKKAAGGSMIKEMVLRAVNEAKKTISQAETASNEYGFSLSDPNTSGKVFKDKKNKVKKDTNSAEEKEAREWSKQMKERIRLLKDSRSWYEKWEKELGHTAALEKVQEMFGDLIKKEDIATLQAYKKALDEVIDKANQRKIKKGGKDENADEVMRQAKDVIEDIDLMEFKQQKESITSQMTRDIESLSRQWDIFNNVLNETGDRFLALKLAGLFDRSSERNAADSLRANIEGMPGGDLIDFDKVMTMTDDEIEKSVKDMLGTSDQYATHIDAIIAGLKEWRKLSEDVMKQDIQDYSKLIAQAVDYEAQIKEINKEFDRQKEMLDALLNTKKISQGQYNSGMSRISANKARGIIEALPEYKMLMDGVLSITKDTARKVKKEMVEALNKQLISGTITAKEYADKINEINERMEQLEHARSKFSSFMEGGLNGLQQKMQKDAQDTIRQGAEQMQVGMFNIRQGANGGGMQQILDGFNQLGKGNKMAQVGEGMQEAAGGFASTIMLIDKIIHGIDQVIQGLKESYDQITEMFDALGNESASDPRSGWGKAGTFLSALSSGSQSATKAWDSLKNGDVGGVISGVVGSFTGPITAIAQAHDARRQAAIDELVFEVKKINNTVNLIRAARERTLGYDNGNYRREMARMYSAGYGKIKSPMIEFYSRGGLEGSGYEQEMESLKKQRADYLKMYNDENSKKKKSKDALEEYKMKIAELDEQIKYFSEDLAKELWSIDLKGWADQIGDALMDAFENGTSAAEAFKDATRGIMQGVVSELLKVGFMEPAFEKLRERLFGKNGAFNYNDPKSSMGDVLSELGHFFGEGGEGQQMILASQEFLTGAEELLNKNFGMSLKDSSGATQTSGIQSQATEESIGILSGQMARIAQDVSVKRIFMTQIATEQMPRLLENAQMQRTLLENQFQSVRAIEHMMADGDGALYASIDRMSRKIDRAITPEGRMRIE